MQITGKQITIFLKNFIIIIYKKVDWWKGERDRET